MSYNIALPGKNEYRTTQNVELDGVRYTIRIYWNDRAQGWYLDLSDQTGKIASGRKLSVNWPILSRDIDRRGPPGELLLYNFAGQEAGIDLAEYQLIYFTATEIAAL